MTYHRQSSRSDFIRTGRSGDWGHLLGDDGGGYELGRQGIRHALATIGALNMRGEKVTESALRSLNPLSQKIHGHFGLTGSNPDQSNSNLLSTVLIPPPSPSEQEDAVLSPPDSKSRIAAIAKNVLEPNPIDTAARQIMLSGARCLAQTLKPLLRRPHGLGIKAEDSVFVLGGGLMRSGLYRGAVLNELSRLDINFGTVEVVRDPAVAGAEYLRQCS